MLAEISLEALRYLDRTALEGLQIQDLRDLVNRHVRTFPLRHIQEVEVSASSITPSFKKTEVPSKSLCILEYDIQFNLISSNITLDPLMHFEPTE